MVIVVIGILAAIVIAAYTGVQSRAKISAIQSDLHSNAPKLVLFKADHVSPPANLADLQAAKLQFSKDNYRWVLYCSDDTSWVLAGRLIDSNRWWIVGPNQPVAESSAPGTSGSDVTTCQNLGFGSGTHRIWIRNSTSWAL